MKSESTTTTKKKNTAVKQSKTTDESFGWTSFSCCFPKTPNACYEGNRKKKKRQYYGIAVKDKGDPKEL